MTSNPSPLCERIGAFVSQLRSEMGFTLRDLAARTDLSVAFLWVVENGRSEPGAGTIVRLCRALRVTPNELLGTDEERG